MISSDVYIVSFIENFFKIKVFSGKKFNFMIQSTAVNKSRLYKIKFFDPSLYSHDDCDDMTFHYQLIYQIITPPSGVYLSISSYIYILYFYNILNTITAFCSYKSSGI